MLYQYFLNKGNADIPFYKAIKANTKAILYFALLLVLQLTFEP